MLTLQDYLKKKKDNYKTTSSDDLVDKMYDSDMGAPTPYYVLHLSDINIDPFYTSGASVKCRDFRCCHARNGFVPQSDPNDKEFGTDVAGPYGSRGCD